ncbi:MAG: CAP domain-containing protein [Burkholderiaceae bacterium]
MRHTIASCGLWFTAALLSACGGGSSGTGAEPASSANVSRSAEPTCDIAGFAGQVVASLNAARATARTCGAATLPPAPPLSWNAALAEAAGGHAADMASVGFFSHTGSNGSHYLERIAASGYQGATGSEILARTERIATPAMLPVSMDAWLKSPPHCAALMRADLTEVGAACQRGGGYAFIAVDFGG